ncbi:MAG: anhydro-N-acetylmuramic acid kinase [Candidatus Azotimanducaceae bacterium]|jgi:anhydro-N-acetylmuramic acid kinase
MNLKKVYSIGLMSGTSLDGVDIVYVCFDKRSGYAFEIIYSDTIPYSDTWKQQLKNAFSQSNDQLNSLDIEYGKYLGSLTNNFIDKHQIDALDFIASHGHTIFHDPDNGYTFQIGDGETISKITGQKVVCDFRTQDVEMGGQGAPLVPVGDKLLFSEYDYCLNLGGFANISFEENNERIAFDICPVNIVMNFYANKKGLEYDDKGNLASKGKVDENLLLKLNEISFYKSLKPKSLGYEFVVSEVFPMIEKYNLEIEDVLRTFVEHIVIQISNKINSPGKLLITGGGTFNTFLIDKLKEMISNEIIVPSETIINYKEALIFSFLGLLRIDNQTNCLKSVTGAKKDHSSGKIFTA